MIQAGLIYLILKQKKIKAALGNSFASIHHFGSTSVPGLAAKPKIDIIACVNNLNFYHQGLADLHYQYRGGFNLPLRKSFTYRSSDLNVNLHIFEENDPEVELNIRFHDYLLENPETRDQYSSLKYKLLEDDASNKKDGAMYQGYTLGNHDLILYSEEIWFQLLAFCCLYSLYRMEIGQKLTQQIFI